MAAYAAVISLKHTINGLLSSSSSSREILESAYNEASSLQQVLEGLNNSNTSRSKSSWERLDGLEGQIRDCANKLEDFLEFHELKLLEEDDEYGDEGVMREEISSFGETAKRMEKEYTQELSRDDDDDDDDDDHEDATRVSSNIDFDVEMIGRRSRLFNATLQSQVLKRMRPDDLYLCSFFGGKGYGSRAVVQSVYKDASEGKCAQKFDCWAWVTLGTGYQVKKVLMNIISQVAVDGDINITDDTSEEELSKHLYKALENRRYMIALDDAKDAQLVKYLRKNSFPDESNGSVVLLATDSEVVVQSTDLWYVYQVPDIYDEDFWLTMRQALFGSENIPPGLEAAGKNIVHNCGGRLISVVKTLLFLSKTDKTVEQWSKIAADKEHPVFMVGDELSEISEIENEMQYCKREIVEQASQWIDFPSEVKRAEKWMHPERFFSNMKIISFFGMAGIGKTTFARKIFKDDSTLSRFDHHVWILLGQKYQKEEILLDILAQIYPTIHKLDTKEDELVIKELCAQVSRKRCLIVLDDLHSKEPLLHLKYLFPAIKGTILVTTRLPKVAKFGEDDAEIEMHLLDEEESWHLLRQKVFVGESCPPELEKAGRKIAEKCDGLPLLIVKVADQLCKVEQSEDYWNNVALGKEKSVFNNAHQEISRTLLPSYHNLPQHLKPCFLYMGVFLEKYEIVTYNLTNLWISEGFLKRNSSQIEEDIAAECLSELADKSLVMFHRKVSGSPITTCRLHSVFWHLSSGQVVKNKLFHAINNYDDRSMENMKGQRRLCVRNNILLSIKDVQMSMVSNESAHSLLCVGPFHQYPVPLSFDLRLLRVMDALTIRLYEFPIEVTILFHLRYLGLTCNGELPTSISKLWKLQHLIVKRYMNIKSSKTSSRLPVEIWDMQELKHLQVVGGCLPNHKSGDGLLKLSTLLDVSAQSCGQEVLKWIPNLKRLGIRIELAPTDDGNSFLYLNNIHHLHKLESLKCVVVNPHLRFDVVPPPAPMMFPQNLRKLSLSGFGYPWEHMSAFGKLENLEVLKLKCCAYIGPIWEMGYTKQFKKLKFLLLEDINLLNWKVCWDLKVERVCIKHCYKLREIPLAFHIPDQLRKIEIVDCGPLLVNLAKRLGQVIPNCEVNIHRSW